MYEYEIKIIVEDKEKKQHIIERYYTLPIVGRYQLKDIIENKLKLDTEISHYTLINYDVTNWNEVS